MMLRWDPWREIDRLASEAFGDVRGPRTMPIDAYRHGDAFLIHYDLPGVEADSIELTVESNVLTVTARRTFDRTESDQLVVSERPQGVFARQLFLGDGLDVDALKATYDSGVLTVEVPVLESAKPRRIPIAPGADSHKEIETTAT